MKKAPLCKGGSRVAGGGLSNKTVDMQIIQNENRDNPSEFCCAKPTSLYRGEA